MKETEEDINRWKDVCGWGESIVSKWLYYSMQSTYSMGFLSNYQWLFFFFHRTRINYVKICMETQKTLNNQSDFEKEKWSGKNQVSWLQTKLQSQSHQNSMVLAQK